MSTFLNSFCSFFVKKSVNIHLSIFCGCKRTFLLKSLTNLLVWVLASSYLLLKCLMDIASKKYRSRGMDFPFILMFLFSISNFFILDSSNIYLLRSDHVTIYRLVNLLMSYRGTSFLLHQAHLKE